MKFDYAIQQQAENKTKLSKSKNMIFYSNAM